MAKQGKRLELFIQVNTGEEPQKAGVIPAELPALVALCRDELALEIAGLMCIPPLEEEPAVHFAFLEKLAAENGFRQLSMGMSDDYETAVHLAPRTCVSAAPFSVSAPIPEVFQRDFAVLGLSVRCGC